MLVSHCLPKKKKKKKKVLAILYPCDIVKVQKEKEMINRPHWTTVL